MPTPTTEQLDSFLRLFDGDILAALEALNRYKDEQGLAKEKAHTPLAAYAQNEVIVSVQKISKVYKLGKQRIDALNEVSLEIHKGEFIVITGASGSGKSTLLQIIGCLDKPSSGTVLIDNKDTTKLSDASLSELRRKTIGFIFQSFYLQPFLRLGDNIAVPAMFTKSTKKDIDTKVKNYLERVGLAERINHYPKQLSGGQIQRAAIARALINTPSIILADEPTGNLDSTNSQSIIDLFKSIRATLGTTIVVVSHDADITRQADRVIRLKDGVAL